MKLGIVLFGHGSRDPQWREPIDEVARRIRERVAGVEVRCAFLELDSPDLPTVAAALAREGVDAIRVIPLFLGVGRHARQDLPRLVEQCRGAMPSVTFDLRPSVGEDSRVLDLLASLSLE